MKTVVLVLLCMTGLLQAVILHVPEDYTEIQSAVDISTPGDTILLAHQIYIENVNIHQKNLVLTSTLNPYGIEVADYVTLIGADSGSCITISDSGWETGVELIGMTLQYGEALFGGGVNITDSRVSMNYIRMTSNWGSQCGGGFFAESSELNFRMTEIEFNLADGDGGGGYLSNCSGEFDYVYVNENLSGRSGGGLRLTQGSMLELETLYCTGNNAEQNGGAMALSDQCELRGRFYVSGNDADGNGGGIFLSGSVIDISEPDWSLSVTENTSEGDGGGIFSTVSSSIRGWVYGHSNSCSGSGGMLAASETVLDIRHSQWFDNTADISGGAMTLIDCNQVDFDHCRFSGNYAGNQEVVLLSNSILTGDHCTVHGGEGFAVSMENGSSAQFSSSILWSSGNAVASSESGLANYLNLSWSDVPDDLSQLQNFDYHTIGVINGDPLFADDACSLTEFSPCIDTGDPEYAPDPDETPSDMGWAYYDQFPCIEGDTSGDGFPGGIQDYIIMLNYIMGYEPWPTGSEFCTADANNDGTIDVVDVLAVSCVLVNEPDQEPESDRYVIGLELEPVLMDLSTSQFQVNLNLQSEQPVGGFQFDLQFPGWEGEDIELQEYQFVTHGEIPWLMFYSEVIENTLRCLIFDHCMSIPPEDDFQLQLFLSIPENPATGEICVTNLSGADTGGYPEYDVTGSCTELVSVEDCEPSADYNNDGGVDILDVVIHVEYIMEIDGPPSPETICIGDLNEDGLITVTDVMVFLLICDGWADFDPEEPPVHFSLENQFLPQAGDTLLIPVYLESDHGVESFQFDLEFESWESVPDTVITEPTDLLYPGVTMKNWIGNRLRFLSISLTGIGTGDTGELLIFKIPIEETLPPTRLNLTRAYSHGWCGQPFLTLGDTAELRAAPEYIAELTLDGLNPDAESFNVLISSSELLRGLIQLTVSGVRFEQVIPGPIFDNPNIEWNYDGFISISSEYLLFTPDAELLLTVEYDEVESSELCITSGQVETAEYGVSSAVDTGECLSLTEFPVYLGDLNLDLEINILDIVMILDFILSETEFNDQQFLRADVNLDGLVDILDVVIIVQWILES